MTLSNLKAWKLFYLSVGVGYPADPHDHRGHSQLLFPGCMNCDSVCAACVHERQGDLYLCAARGLAPMDDPGREIHT